MTAEPVPQCLVCHRPRASWGVCDGCIARVDAQLAELLDLHALASATAALEPGRSGDPGPIGAGRAAPLPLNLGALDLAVGEWLVSEYLNDRDERVWNGLETWERDVRHTFGLMAYGKVSARRTGYESATMPREGHASLAGDTQTPNPMPDTNLDTSGVLRDAQPVSTLVGVIGFLRAWWPRVADEHPAADEFANDVRRMHGAARAALRLAEDRPWTVPCPADLGDRECGYPLEVEHVGRELGLHCKRCGSDWTVERLLLVAAAAGRGVWVTVAEAAEQVGCHRATIYRAVQDGAIVSRYGRVDLVSVREWRTRAV